MNARREVMLSRWVIGEVAVPLSRDVGRERIFRNVVRDVVAIFLICGSDYFCQGGLFFWGGRFSFECLSFSLILVVWEGALGCGS